MLGIEQHFRQCPAGGAFIGRLRPASSPYACGRGHARAAYRLGNATVQRGINLGFRVGRTLTP
jgi:hypothetical protein